MKLNNYIIASLLYHLLLFGIIITFLPKMKTEVSIPIFDVDIVGPVVEEKTLPKTREVPVRPSPPVPRKSAPKDVSKEPPPKTMFGEGIDSSQSGTTVPGKDKESKKDLSTDETVSSASPGKEGVLPEASKGLPLSPKSFLFDKETIEKYAQKNTTAKKGLTFDAPELQHRGYMKMLKDKIESIWKYPEESARRGISGDLYIRFFIQRDGKLGKMELIRTSGFRALDEAAMKALREAEPFWPLPEDWEKDSLEIKGHFIYMLGSGYIL